MATENIVLTQLEWTPMAWEHYLTMRSHCAKLRAYYGDDIANRSEVSLGRCLMQLFAAGPCHITEAFGYQGLYVVTPAIHMGVVWFADGPDRFTKLTGHDVREPDWPETGEWSCHS
jgi:hypothetical protein